MGKPRRAPRCTPSIASKDKRSAFQSCVWLALAVNEGQFYCRSCPWWPTQERRFKSSLIRFGLGNGTPPPSGIDLNHGRPRMKSIAVEAFGRHLKGADASVPFSLDRFSENLELPHERNDPIPRLSYTRLGIGLQTISLSSSLYSSRMLAVLLSSGQHIWRFYICPMVSLRPVCPTN